MLNLILKSLTIFPKSGWAYFLDMVDLIYLLGRPPYDKIKMQIY